MGAISDDSGKSILRGEGVLGVRGIFGTGPYSRVGAARVEPAGDEDEGSVLSLVIERLGGVCAGNKGAKRPPVWVPVEELVRVSSLGVPVDAIVGALG